MDVQQKKAIKYVCKIFHYQAESEVPFHRWGRLRTPHDRNSYIISAVIVWPRDDCMFSFWNEIIFRLIALQVKRSLPKVVPLQLDRSHFRNREHMKRFYKRKTDTNWVVKRYELPISLLMEEKPSKSSCTVSFFFFFTIKQTKHQLRNTTEENKKSLLCFPSVTLRLLNPHRD